MIRVSPAWYSKLRPVKSQYQTKNTADDHGAFFYLEVDNPVGIDAMLQNVGAVLF